MKFLATQVLILTIAVVRVSSLTVGQQDLVPLVALAKVIPCTTVSECSQHITAHSHLICKNHQCRSKCNTGYLATDKGKCRLIICNPAKCTQAIPKKSTYTCVANKCSYVCNLDNYFNGVSCVSKVCTTASQCHRPPPNHATVTCSDKNICSFICDAGYIRSGTYCKKLPATTCTAASQCLLTPPPNGAVYCSLGKCATACKTGYQLSRNKASCVPNPTHCLKTACQKINSGQVKCKNNNVCTYSCNAVAGYTLHTFGKTNTCYNYNKDPKNCGSFENICATETPFCAKGVCIKPKMARLA